MIPQLATDSNWIWNSNSRGRFGGYGGASPALTFEYDGSTWTSGKCNCLVAKDSLSGAELKLQDLFL